MSAANHQPDTSGPLSSVAGCVRGDPCQPAGANCWTPPLNCSSHFALDGGTEPAPRARAGRAPDPFIPSPAGAEPRPGGLPISRPLRLTQTRIGATRCRTGDGGQRLHDRQSGDRGRRTRGRLPGRRRAGAVPGVRRRRRRPCRALEAGRRGASWRGWRRRGAALRRERGRGDVGPGNRLDGEVSPGAAHRRPAACTSWAASGDDHPTDLDDVIHVHSAASVPSETTGGRGRADIPPATTERPRCIGPTLPCPAPAAAGGQGASAPWITVSSTRRLDRKGARRRPPSRGAADRSLPSVRVHGEIGQDRFDQWPSGRIGPGPHRLSRFSAPVVTLFRTGCHAFRPSGANSRIRPFLPRSTATTAFASSCSMASRARRRFW